MREKEEEEEEEDEEEEERQMRGRRSPPEKEGNPSIEDNTRMYTPGCLPN